MDLTFFLTILGISFLVLGVAIFVLVTTIADNKCGKNRIIDYIAGLCCGTLIGLLLFIGVMCFCVREKLNKECYQCVEQYCNTIKITAQ